MIAPQELRIGNWVLDEDGKMSSVKSINDRTVGLHTTFYAHSSSYKTISPLPLSPEILEKCGFVKGENDRLVFHFRGFFEAAQSIEVPNSVILYCNNRCVSEPIKYLHQLQNLYFALTNQELQIKL